MAAAIPKYQILKPQPCICIQDFVKKCNTRREKTGKMQQYAEIS
jgi:hypothetical protein